MRKEELDRRSAELKARMLAQRNEGRPDKSSTAAKRRSITKPMLREDDASRNSANADIGALNERIVKLEKENESLRQQLAMMSRGVVESAKSSTDSVREQRHNFFKYSNIRRY